MRQFIKERRNYEKMINTSHIHLVNWEICLTCDNGLALKMLESYFQTVFFFLFFCCAADGCTLILSRSGDPVFEFFLFCFVYILWFGVSHGFGSLDCVLLLLHL